MIRKTSKIPGDAGRPAGWIVLLCFAAGTALLYLPVWGNGFLTDDYAALYRLLIEKRVLFEEMVRPLIDISFYFNYLISGLHPVSYYIFNGCIHVLTCFMVYRVALDLPLFTGRRQVVFALTAGFLFLLYPFHNEGVVWLSGRLSSMAALSGLMAIHFSLTKRQPWNVLLAVLWWFIGLFAYESILLLPGIVILLEWIKFRDVGRCLRNAVGWMVAGILWLGMRYVVTRQVLPAYAKGGLVGDPIWLRSVKVLGRCFLPPGGNPGWMIFLFGGVMVVIGVVHVLMWRRKGGDRRGWPYLNLEICFLLALLPAVAFGVSTQTSEGDRLLYFPSGILCLLGAAVLLSLLPGRRWRLLLCAAYAVGSVVFIAGNNQRWVFASRTAETVLDTLRSAPGRVVLVDAPDEWEGAFIFRNNFNTGLVINKIDTNKVVVPHFLLRLEYLVTGGRVDTGWQDSSLLIYPGVRIVQRGEWFRVVGIGDSFRVATDRVYYWDRFGLKKVNLQ